MSGRGGGGRGGRGGGRGQAQQQSDQPGGGRGQVQQQSAQAGGGRGPGQQQSAPAGGGRGPGQQQSGQAGGGRGPGQQQSVQAGGGRGPGQQQSAQAGGGRGQGQQAQAGGGRGQGQQPWAQPGGGGAARGDGGRGRGVVGGGSGDGSGRGRGRGPYPTPTPTSSVASLSTDVQNLNLQPSASASAWSKPGSSARPQPPPAAQPQVAPATHVAPVSQVAPVRAAVQQIMVAPTASSKAIRPPARPGYGKAGRKCIVKANHFRVQVTERDLHHYDVSITPEVTSKKYCRQIMSELVKEHYEIHLGKRLLAYDGRKSAYTGGPLPFVSKDFVVTLIDDDRATKKERQFKVSIKFAAKADFHHLQQFLQGKQHDAPQETIQALDVALRATPSDKYEVVGRSFFSPNLGEFGMLGNGIAYWKGFYQSLRPTQMGLSLNIDMSARSFYAPINLIDFVGDYFDRDPTRALSDQDRIKLRKVLKGLKVELNHQGYKRRSKISGLSPQPLSQLMFTDDTGARKSVVQYFHEKYDIRLEYTNLPAIQSGSDSKPVYLPMEMCKLVEGQRYTRKLNEKQVTQLLRATCQRPNQREGNIEWMVKENKYKEIPLVTKEFGMEVLSNLTSVEARVLVPPTLKYHDSGKNKTHAPRVGQWNMIDTKMVNGATVNYWTCVSFSRANLDPLAFAKDLVNMCTSKGMVFAAPLLPIAKANSNTIDTTLAEIHRQSAAKLKNVGDGKQKLQLLIIILPDTPGYHGRIKKKCETELGIISQCCQAKQAMKGGKQYLENLSLKINVKTGGRNTVLADALTRRIPYLTEMPTIIFGADVTHPQPGEDSSPSIAAVVASMDWPEVTKYRALVSAQAHREEIIVDLHKTTTDAVKGVVNTGLIREHLIAYRRSTGFKPHRLIFYRDGVSEGQFSQVLLHEVDAIRQACNSLEKDYQPRITFIVVQKRHHTRLFPNRHGDRDNTDKSGNILPGTVVDTQICHPTEFDFYLCSHAGIQGTSRPAHYHVLYDENNFTADGLQNLTNSLCYTYARCTRSVSIVPPAYYAHLAAFRARDYMEGEYSDSGSNALAGGGANPTRERNAEYFMRLPQMKDNVKDVMFYC